MIPYARQDINDADIQAVVDVLRSDFLTQGPVVPAFEAAVARYCGAEYGVAVNSATSALHLACLALGIGAGDRVWTSPITFVASATCALHCGAQVDFVDIDPLTYNLSVERLADKLAEAERANRLPKIVVAVHFSGQPCDMVGLHELSQRYGFRVIEDASHALGARYRDQRMGNGRYSDITVFSFHAVKLIATGEGGIALTNSVELAQRMQRLRTHGITRATDQMIGVSEGSWYYQQLELGFNYRLTDIQAALGLSQMKRIDEFLAKRHRLAARYDQALEELPLVTPWRHPDDYSGLHLYAIRLKLSEIGKTRREVIDSMRAAGIGVNVHYIPVYRQPYFERLGFTRGRCPEAESYYSEAISLPMFPALTEEQQDGVVSALSAAVSR